MLMDMLGILTGFVAIMLLFSLLVTALVHGAQAALDLRFKNLKSVIDHFLTNMNLIECSAAQKIMDQLEKRFTSNLYATALPVNIGSNKLKVNKIDKEELIDMVNNTPDMGLDQKEQLRQKILDHFETVEEIMSQRFKQWMHQISIAVAFSICFIFQLNCFDLLKQLNEDTAFRYKAMAIGNQYSTNDSLPDMNPETNLAESPINNQAQTNLQALNFKITPNQWMDYYVSPKIDTLTNWFGIIFSSILISLGAPFWFNRLKDLVSLRDQLSKAKK